MVLIQSIEILYFRSLYKFKAKNFKDLTVFTGLNDVGKSNVIKALNQFFNGKTDWGKELSFSIDFSIRRREEVRQNTIKGKQFIKISITFNRGDWMPNTLPPIFTVSKTWLRDGSVVENNDDVHRKMKSHCDKNGTQYSQPKTQSALKRFLNSIQYVYIPAVKDQSVFNFVLRKLQKTIFNDANQALLNEPINNVNEKISAMVQGLQLSFEKATGINSTIAIPQTLNLSQGLLSIGTQYGDTREVIMLDKRGDGIKAHYIPQMLNYISSKSTNKFIWGFEEPENSYEFRRCLQIATEFRNVFCINNQIIITSHSPAFYNNHSDNISIIRVIKKDNMTENLDQCCSQDIDEELGYAELYSEYIQKLEELEKVNRSNIKQILKLQEELSENRCPILLTEGKNDATIMNIALGKRNIDIHGMLIRSCDTIDEQQNGSDAGATRLKAALESAWDNDRILIGLFDKDSQGIQQFSNLNANFLTKTINLDNGDLVVFKKRNNGKVAALCLPVPRTKIAYDTAKNLSIEFYFDDQYLNLEVENKKLLLKRGTIIQKMPNGVLISQVESSLPEHRQIEGNKTHFAEKVVPTLPDEAFTNFDILFETINKIFSSFQGNH